MKIREKVEINGGYGRRVDARVSSQFADSPRRTLSPAKWLEITLVIVNRIIVIILTQKAPTPLTVTTFLRTAAPRQVLAGAAEFGSAENRCSSFDGIFIETKSTDQLKY